MLLSLAKNHPPDAHLTQKNLVNNQVQTPNLSTVIALSLLCQSYQTIFLCKRPLERANRDGDEGTRTPDLLRAREALSHLSYIPYTLIKVGLTRLELVTFPLSEERSNRLSYRP